MKTYLQKTTAVLFAVLLVLTSLPLSAAFAESRDNSELKVQASAVQQAAKAPALHAKVSGGTAFLSWDSTSGADSYEVQLRKYGETYSPVSRVQDTRLKLNLSYNTTYYVRIRPCFVQNSGVQYGTYYPTVRFTVGPKAPVIRLAQQEKYLKVSWSGSSADSWGVYIREAGGRYSRARLTTKNACLIPDLKPGTTYYVTVKGFEKFGGRYYAGSYGKTQKITFQTSYVIDGVGLVPAGKEYLYPKYEKLPAAERKLYQGMLHRILQGKTALPLSLAPNSDYKIFNRVYGDVLDDHPEFFWLDGSGKYKLYGDSYYFYCGLAVPKDQILSMHRENKREADAIVQAALRYKTDYEKALFVHDTLVNRVTYDMEAYQNGWTPATEINGEHAYHSYGALVEHRAVCQGYAEAYALLMRRLGICSGVVTGKANGGGHAWNYIRLDGDYYHVDVTWDDPVSSRPILDHDYFCINTKTILRDHWFDQSAFPVCNGTKYNYKKMSGSYLEKYTFAGAKEILERGDYSGKVYLYFSSPAEALKAKQDLVDFFQILNIPIFRTNRDKWVYWYHENEDSIAFALEGSY